MSDDDDDNSTTDILTSWTPTSGTSVFEDSDNEKPWWKTRQKLVVLGVVTVLGIIGVVLATTALITGNGPAESEASPTQNARRLEESEKPSPEPETTRSTPAVKWHHPTPAKKATKAKRKPKARTTNKRKRKATSIDTGTISVADETVGERNATEEMGISSKLPKAPPSRTESPVPSKTMDSLRRMAPRSDGGGTSGSVVGRVSTGNGSTAQRRSSTDLSSLSSLHPSTSSAQSDKTTTRFSPGAPEATKGAFSTRAPLQTSSSTPLPTISSTPSLAPSKTFQRTSWAQNGDYYANFSAEDPFTLNDFVQ